MPKKTRVVCSSCKQPMVTFIEKGASTAVQLDNPKGFRVQPSVRPANQVALECVDCGAMTFVAARFFPVPPKA